MKTLFALLAALGLGVAIGCDSPKVQKAEDKVKEAAHDTAEAGKEAAHEAAHAVKEGAEKVEEETK